MVDDILRHASGSGAATPSAGHQWPPRPRPPVVAARLPPRPPSQPPLSRHGSPPPPPSQPNYERLTEILGRLYQPIDAQGQTMLTYEEAAAIRAAGFTARANSPWFCPPLPPELAYWNPLVAHMSSDLDLDFWCGKKKRALPRIAARPQPLSRIEQKVLAHLRKQPFCMTKRRLQQKMWRLPARFFNHVIRGMIREGRITLHLGLLYPYTRDQFIDVFNIQPGLPAQAFRAGYTNSSAGSALSR